MVIFQPALMLDELGWHGVLLWCVEKNSRFTTASFWLNWARNMRWNAFFDCGNWQCQTGTMPIAAQHFQAIAGCGCAKNGYMCLRYLQRYSLAVQLCQCLVRSQKIPTTLHSSDRLWSTETAILPSISIPAETHRRQVHATRQNKCTACSRLFGIVFSTVCACPGHG